MIFMYEVMDKKDGNIYSYDQMVKMYDEEKTNYSYVHKRLVCPCCQRSVIAISINDDEAVIKSKRMNHRNDCDYYGFKITQQQIKQRIRNKIGFDDIKPSDKKKMPKKCVERRFSEDDIDMYKKYYGHVFVKKAYSKDESRYINFSFKAKRGDAFVISFSTEHKDVVNKLETLIDQEIYLSIIGQLREVDGYYNINLKHISLFNIEEV